MDKKNLFETTHLFKTTSFLIGLGSILNIFGNYYRFNTSKTTKEADHKAIESDWGVTGQDINKAISELKKEFNIK